MPEPIQKLLLMPRFWVLIISAATGIYLYIKGEITADQLATIFVALAGLVVVALTAQQAVEKITQAQIVSAAYRSDAMRSSIQDVAQTLARDTTLTGPNE